MKRYLLYLSMSLAWLLQACTSETPESCDFTEKLTHVAIDRQLELLQDPEAVQQQIQLLEDTLFKKEAALEGESNLLLETTHSDDPQPQEERSKSLHLTHIKVDLLTKLLDTKNSLEKEKWLWLYRQILWSENFEDRSFFQSCHKRIVLKEQPSLVQPSKEIFFIQGMAEDVPVHNAYFPEIDRVAYLNRSHSIFEYTQFSTGRGFSTAFMVRNTETGALWKVKLGWEAYREPLATQLASTLGFNVDPVMHTRELHVHYHQELESLFSQKGKKIADSLAGIVLNDNEHVSFIAEGEPLQDVHQLYESYRSQIKLLIFKSVSMEPREGTWDFRLGSWSFDALSNYEIQAVRMLGLLSFFVSNEDIKFDNNKILFALKPDVSLEGDIPFTKLHPQQGAYRFHFAIHDMGLSFSDRPDQIPNTRDIRRDTDGRISLGYQTRGRDVFAWHQITYEDAIVFAERLSMITEKQYLQMAAAAGYPYPVVVLIAEKLKSIRNHFLETLAPGRFPMMEANPNDVSVSSSGHVDIGTNNPLLVPQDGFVVENGRIVNDISLGFQGRHSEMVRK